MEGVVWAHTDEDVKTVMLWPTSEGKHVNWATLVLVVVVVVRWFLGKGTGRDIIE